MRKIEAVIRPHLRAVASVPVVAEETWSEVMWEALRAIVSRPPLERHIPQPRTKNHRWLLA